MSGNKYLSVDVNGDLAELAANQTSAGSADAGKVVALGSGGTIDPSMLPNTDSTSVLFSESVAAGAIVNIYNNAGTRNARNGDASSYAKRAIGFVSGAVTSGATATVNFIGVISGLSGLTAGTEYFLSDTTPGSITATPVTTSGHILQSVGTALSATELDFKPAARPIIRA